MELADGEAGPAARLLTLTPPPWSRVTGLGRASTRRGPRSVRAHAAEAAERDLRDSEAGPFRLDFFLPMKIQ